MADGDIATRALPSDDAIAEAAKKAVRNAGGSLELVYDEKGIVINARPKKLEPSPVQAPPALGYVEE